MRSPGIYYEASDDKSGKKLYAATVIPYRGAWLEYETDANDIFYVRIDKNRKLPVTVFLRALGLSTDRDLTDMFGNDEKLKATMSKDLMESEAEKKGTSPYEESLKEIYKKLRPGDPAIVESAQILLNNLFFDAKRYDISAVGRYKFNKKLALARRIAGFKLSRPAVNPFTGEVIFDENTLLNRESAQKIEDAGVSEVYLYSQDIENPVEFKVFNNHMAFIDKLGIVPESYDLSSLNLEERVHVGVLREILDTTSNEEEFLAAFKQRKAELIPKHITRDDIYASVNYMLCLAHNCGNVDDIDHLGNRRLRSVGELLQNQMRIGFTRMEKLVKERMTMQET